MEDQLSFPTIHRVECISLAGAVPHAFFLIGEAVLVPALPFVYEWVALVISGVVV